MCFYANNTHAMCFYCVYIYIFVFHFSLNRLIYNKIIKIKIEKQRHKQGETSILDSGTIMVTIKWDIKYFKFLSNLQRKETTKVYKIVLSDGRRHLHSSGSCGSKTSLPVGLELRFGGAELVEPKHEISWFFSFYFFLTSWFHSLT